jgi:hypothetical protein
VIFDNEEGKCKVMQDDTITQLTDLALRIKEAVEDKNEAALIATLGPHAQININGRFLTHTAFTSSLKDLLSKIEQPVVDIISIEESDIKEGSAFVAYIIEFSWVDQEVWEEHSVLGRLSLQQSRREDSWIIEGFTFSQRPKPAEPSLEGSHTTLPAAFDSSPLDGSHTTLPPVLNSSSLGLGNLVGGRGGTGDTFSF